MSTRAFIASIIAAGVLCATLVISLTFMATPSSSSRSGPTCAVRTSAEAAPTDKAKPFGGSGSLTMSTPAAPVASCGPTPKT